MTKITHRVKILYDSITEIILNLIGVDFMSFTFREKEMEVPGYCIIQDLTALKIVHASGTRFPFHEKIKTENDNDLCHSFSFDGIASCICFCANEIENPEEKTEYLTALLNALYLQADYAKGDFLDAMKIVTLIASEINPLNLLHYCNELLYILNNAAPNLRIGNSKWNRSLGAAYDPTQWVFNFEENRFEITDENDGKRLTLLMNLPTYLDKSLFLYSCLLNNGMLWRPALYSSSNKKYGYDFQLLENVQQFNAPICYQIIDLSGTITGWGDIN